MAATIYEPLSTAHLKSCTVDFDSRPDKKAVNLVQYDQTIPVLCVSLKKGGTEYKVPSDADVNIRMDKRDGYHVYNPALGVNAERTIAYFAVTPQMSTGWGDYYPIVEITVGGGIAGSAPIWLQFDRNPLPENAIISSDEYKTIQQLLEDVTAVKAATEQIKAQTEAVRDQAKGFADNAKNSADKAQTLVDGMPSDYSQAMKDIGTLKNQMQHAYPDDSTIGENPWSSKHIIDMLCPPLEESGNPVVCSPVAGYPLGVKASWEPMQEGTGTPSPENIRPIKGRDSVTVTRCGENLLDVAQCRAATPSAAYGLTVTVDDTGLIRVFGTPKVNKDTPQATFRVLFTDQVILTKEYKVKLFVLKGVANSITRIQSDKSIVLQSTLSPNTPVDIQFRFMYYTGTTAPTTYTPYNGQTNTLTLPETVYGGEVDAVSGDGNENTKIITLDGTTNMFRLSGEFWNLPQNSSPGIRNGYDTNCSHFPPETFSGNKNKGYLFTKPQLLGKYFQDVNAFNAYLAAQYAAGTPVQVSYKLAEPVPFTATGAKPLPALVGMNTVLTDADSATVTGRADPIKRITDLEAAVASIN